jgi:hypothetical protein
MYINAGFPADRGAPIRNADSSAVAILVYNNRFSSPDAPAGCAGLLVLPLDSAYGVAPPYHDSAWDLSQVSPGNQLAYVLFPPTDLNRVLGLSYNDPLRLVASGEYGLMVETLEGSDPFAGVNYYIDTDYRVRSVKVDDGFITSRATRVASGELPQVVEFEYCQQLRERVIYWTDSGWVTEAQLLR